MAGKTINSPQDALALANVINPGGQRVNQDGTFTPGLERHETNCALVAVATAAFMIDGTEAGAFAAPSALLYIGNRELVQYVLSDETLSRQYPPEIEVRGKSVSEVKNELLGIIEKFPSQAIVIHGIGENGHHWFNLNQDGTAFDAQVGQFGDQLLLGQIAYIGSYPFETIYIYPVDKSLDGKALLASCEGLHQYNAMLDLARYVDLQLKDNFEIYPEDASSILVRVVDPYTDQHIEKGRKDTGDLANEVTAQWFNEYCEERIELLDGLGVEGDKVFTEFLSDSLKAKPGLETGDSGSQTWLAESTFRLPADVTPTQRVVDKFAGLCPVLNKAMSMEIGIER